MRRTLPAILLLLALSLVGGGCVVNANSARGSIRVQWQPISGSTCASLGVARVQIELTNQTTHTIVTTNDSFCETGSSTVLIDAGTYSIAVTGLSSANQFVTDTSQEVLTVVGGATTFTSILPLRSPASIAFNWTVGGLPAATGCSQFGITQVSAVLLDKSQKTVISTTPFNCASGVGEIPVSVSDTYYLQLDGFAPSDAKDSPSFGNSPLTGPIQFVALGKLALGTVNLASLKAPAFGGLSVGWTAFGQAAAAGCASKNLTNVTVKVLGADKTQVLASTPATCASGVLALSNLPAGSIYVQIDGVLPGLANAYGNVNLMGPLTITANTTTTSPLIDLAARTVLSLDLAFSDNSACAAHGIGSWQIQLLDPQGKILVPFNDADTKKPCGLSSQATYANRVVDLQNSPPKCAIPPNAKGLVLCNVATPELGIDVIGADAASGAITFGGSMLVKQIVQGTHLAVDTPLWLSQCGVGGNVCGHP